MRITERKPFTPGVILNEEFMKPHGLTQGELGKRIGVARRRVNEIIVGRRRVTTDTAIRLSILFGTSSVFWLNLQMKTDLWNALNEEKNKPIEEQSHNKIVPLNNKE